MLEATLAPFDVVRGKALRLVAPHLSSWIVSRERRVTLGLCVMLATTLAMTLTVPMWMLAVSPMLLGVPHLLSDVRYLLVRPGVHRRLGMALSLALGCGLVTAGYGLRGGLVATAGIVLASRASRLRKALILVPVAAFWIVVYRAGWVADTIFAHAHNLVAVLLVAIWRPVRTRAFWLPVAAYVLVCALVLAGALDGVAFPALAQHTPFRTLGLGYFHWVLAPGLDDTMASRIVLFFCFGQAMHYAVWLRFVPELDRPSETPRSFAQSYRALRTDLGAWLVALAVVLFVGFAVWGCVDLHGARDGYLKVSLFHGHLELAALALLLCEGRRARS